MATHSKYGPFTVRELTEKQLFQESKKMRRRQIGNHVFRKLSRSIRNLSIFDLTQLAAICSEKIGEYKMITHVDLIEKLKGVNRYTVLTTQAVYEDEGRLLAMLQLLGLETHYYQSSRLYDRFSKLICTTI
jgi:hypothetical protein